MGKKNGCNKKGPADAESSMGVVPKHAKVSYSELADRGMIPGKIKLYRQIVSLSACLPTYLSVCHEGYSGDAWGQPF